MAYTAALHRLSPAARAITAAKAWRQWTTDRVRPRPRSDGNVQHREESTNWWSSCWPSCQLITTMPSGTWISSRAILQCMST